MNIFNKSKYVSYVLSLAIIILKIKILISPIRTKVYQKHNISLNIILILVTCPMTKMYVENREYGSKQAVKAAHNI